MNKKLICAVITTATICIEAKAANISETWSGGSSGSLLWEDSANWTPAGIPSNNVTNNYYAVVGDATGGRTIVTSGSLAVSGFSVSQTSSTGTNAISLGGNLTLVSTSAFSNNSGFSNTTGDASKLVIDLNGYVLNFGGLTTGQTNLGSASNYTISSSTGAGTIVIPTVGASSTNVQVGNNVTVVLNSVNAVNVSGWNWSAGSTLQATGTPVSAVNLQAGTLGSLVIGSTSNTSATKLIMRNATTRVAGDLNILSYSGATGGDASSFTFFNASTLLYVGGNFVDAGTNGTTYGAGTVIFNGGAAATRQVSIRRTGLSNNFQVGETTSISGNVELDYDLTTSGTFRVLANSEINVGEQTLTAGTVSLDNSANVTLTLGDTSGLIASSGNLTLSGFNLELVSGGGWTDGDDLILFTYAGTLTGTPTLLSVVAPGITYGTLVNDTLNKTIYLTDVNVVPEPTTAAMALCGGMILGWRRTRRTSSRQI